MKAIVRLGDKLTSGGSVISVTSTMQVDGILAALVGDTVSCPREGHGINSIIEGASDWISDNKSMVLDGSLCACGCRVIASSTGVGII